MQELTVLTKPLCCTLCFNQASTEASITGGTHHFLADQPCFEGLFRNCHGRCRPANVERPASLDTRSRAWACPLEQFTGCVTVRTRAGIAHTVCRAGRSACQVCLSTAKQACEIERLGPPLNTDMGGASLVGVLCSYGCGIVERDGVLCHDCIIDIEDITTTSQLQEGHMNDSSMQSHTASALCSVALMV